jgi:hypothetical protein
MKRIAFLLAWPIAWLALPVAPSTGQMVVTGARTTTISPPSPVMHGKTVVVERQRRRDRNPYFAARPVYPPPANRGARANITFEPFTRWYYPNERSYFPPLTTYPSIRTR